MHNVHCMYTAHTMQGNPKTDCRKPKNKKNSARASLHVHAGLMILYVLHAYADPPSHECVYCSSSSSSSSKGERKEGIVLDHPLLSQLNSAALLIYVLSSSPLSSMWGMQVGYVGYVWSWRVCVIERKRENIPPTPPRSRGEEINK